MMKPMIVKAIIYILPRGAKFVATFKCPRVLIGDTTVRWTLVNYSNLFSHRTIVLTFKNMTSHRSKLGATPGIHN
jgi:hypothetical protein